MTTDFCLVKILWITGCILMYHCMRAAGHLFNQPSEVQYGPECMQMYAGKYVEQSFKVSKFLASALKNQDKKNNTIILALSTEVNHWKGLFVGAADKVHRRHNLASLRSKYSTDLLNLIGKMLNPDKKARPTAGELHMEVTNERCITI